MNKDVSVAKQLLSIALTVERHGEGEFYWVLLESFDRSMEFETLMEAASAFPTYVQALQAGVEALKNLSEDLSVGPQDDLDTPEDEAPLDDAPD